jgi:hypothetical protein
MAINSTISNGKIIIVNHDNAFPPVNTINKNTTIRLSDVLMAADAIEETGIKYLGIFIFPY